MANNPLFPEDPDDTRAAIMEATFDALAEHGYSDLTINQVSQRFAKSEGLIFYHYDGKDEILLELLKYLLERVQKGRLPIADDVDPETRLRALLDNILPTGDEHQKRDYEKVLVELRTRAIHNEDYRECFNRSQMGFRESVREIIVAGIESGDFREVDPDSVADFILALVSGEIFDRITVDRHRTVRTELDDYIEDRLLAVEES
ncbi:TetR family transcription regulator [Halobacterium hubeiense]|uniref:TetR family transcription regulator n=1 Tax=Halobacterium hubeiense TaxID=1407499 RepID=A0A0U5CV44_9EURY|nr:TetR family transcriptional regulator C-terminal domain-containing protein [Halobacterium hubeiense]CQH45675.1 TetR family transcription regulator [Halobacterium hubeiense]